MTALRVFSSTDSGAPVLSGQVGALVNVLDAVLVDGYGAGPSATAPAGWTREFSAAHKRVYRGDVAGGSGYYLRVDDAAAVGNARHAWIRGYEMMSAIDAGTNPVPTVAQLAEGALWQKSITLDATARAWVIVANDKTAYVFFDCAGLGIANAAPFGFGDILSHKPGDNHTFFLSCGSVQSYTGSTASFHGTMFRGNSVGTSVGALGDNNGPIGAIARSYSGLVGAVLLGTVGEDCWGSTVYGRGSVAYPDPVSSGVLWGAAHVREAANVVRGKLPGVLVPAHFIALTDLATIAALEGGDGISAFVKSFRTNNLNQVTYAGQVMFDLTTEY